MSTTEECKQKLTTYHEILKIKPKKQIRKLPWEKLIPTLTKQQIEKLKLENVIKNTN